MSLNNIHLPASLVASLYAKSLTDTGEITALQTVPADAPAEAFLPEHKIHSLGHNQQQILVLVNTAEAVHIPDNELQFLTKMLSACRLSLADVAIVNLHGQPVSYKELLTQFKSRVALLFGIEPAELGLPMNFPHYQLQSFAQCSFFYAPSLKELEADKLQKSKLWVSLKRLFSI